MNDPQTSQHGIRAPLGKKFVKICKNEWRKYMHITVEIL